MVIDIPDDFRNELLYRAANKGLSLRRQIITAICHEFDWPEDRIPQDGRYKVDGGVPIVRTNGHSPRNMPLDEFGLPDFDRITPTVGNMQRKPDDQD